jgi:hypothetical protein
VLDVNGKASTIAKGWAAAATLLAAVALLAVTAPGASAKSCAASKTSGGSYGVTIKATGVSCNKARKVFKATKCNKKIGGCQSIAGWTCTPKLIGDSQVKSVSCARGNARVSFPTPALPSI